MYLKYKMVDYKCKKCNKIFDQKSHYEVHINRKTPCEYNVTSSNISNDENKQNICKLCNKSFANKWNLKRHSVKCNDMGELYKKLLQEKKKTKN